MKHYKHLKPSDTTCVVTYTFLNSVDDFWVFPAVITAAP